ncbi:MAG TPA: hypothetical protein PK446_05750, partial [Methanomassiliicoccaceae archaeon]|nr:hypothetical protein [Methanomassiliicoccaceae archaeon]
MANTLEAILDEGDAAAKPPKGLELNTSVEVNDRSVALSARRASPTTFSRIGRASPIGRSHMPSRARSLASKPIFGNMA